jgi:hypothetical protein
MAEVPNGGEAQAHIYRPLASLVGLSNFLSQFLLWPLGREEVRIHAALHNSSSRHTHTHRQRERESEVTSRCRGLVSGELDCRKTAHDGGDLSGLHDGDILILSLRIAISDRCFTSCSSPKVFFLVYFLI